jgi:hypothetical protein
MDAPESSAPHAQPFTEEQDHPHACLNGYIYLGYTALMSRRAKRSSASRRCPAAAAPNKLAYSPG